MHREIYALIILALVSVTLSFTLLYIGSPYSITAVFFWTLFFAVVILAELFYRQASIKKLEEFILGFNVAEIILFAYLSLSSVYFLIPLVIVAIPVLFFRRRVFFGVNLFTQFIGGVALVYVINDILNQINPLLWIFMFMLLNALLSVLFYMMKTYKDLYKPLKKKGTKFDLRIPRYYLVFVFGFIVLVIFSAVYMIWHAFEVNKLGFIPIYVFVIIVFGLVGYRFSIRSYDISIDKNTLSFKSLFGKKENIPIKSIKKFIVKKVVGLYYGSVIILEIHLPKEVKRIDIRTHYNYKDILQFMQTAKNILGKKFAR